MNDELTKQIDEWHKADRHQEITDALEQIPEAEQDYETVSLLARAYNNIDEKSHNQEFFESAFTNDELEYELPAPVPEDKAMEAAIQQYAFCPDRDQNCDGVGSLADTLRQSRIWYFWWN